MWFPNRIYEDVGIDEDHTLGKLCIRDSSIARLCSSQSGSSPGPSRASHFSKNRFRSSGDSNLSALCRSLSRSRAAALSHALKVKPSLRAWRTKTVFVLVRNYQLDSGHWDALSRLWLCVNTLHIGAHQAKRLWPSRPHRISTNSPSVSCSSARMSARIASSGSQRRRLVEVPRKADLIPNLHARRHVPGVRRIRQHLPS